MKFLFVCTHNACRSIIAEVTARAAGLAEVASAGAEPRGEIHPDALHYLQAAGYETRDLASESMDDYEAWQPDVVITLCDSAAGDPCVAFFVQGGKPILRAHWGMSDPSKVQGTEAEKAGAFEFTIAELRRRSDEVAKHIAQANGAQNGAGLKQLLEELGA